MASAAACCVEDRVEGARCAPLLQLLETVLHNCSGAADEIVPPMLEMAVRHMDCDPTLWP